MSLPRLVLVATVAASACSTSPLERFFPATMFAGTVPNAVVMTECDRGRVAVVAASVDARVNIIDVDDGRSTSLVLPEGSNPWDVAIVETGAAPLAVVSLFNDDAIALFDPCREAPEVLQIIGDDSPLAVDDDDIDEMLPSNPQALAVGHDDDGLAIYLAWTNIIALARGDEPMRTGPGLLTRLRLVDDRLVVDGGLVLPCRNPAGLVADGTRVIVACSGVFKTGVDGFERAGVGGLVIVDTTTFAVAKAIDVDAAPASVIVDGLGIVVGDALDGTIARYDGDLVEMDRTEPTSGMSTVFALDVIDGVLVAAHFEDRLVADPFGAAKETSIAQGSTFRGIVDLVHDERDIFALLSTSGELIRIDRETVIGGLQ